MRGKGLPNSSTYTYSYTSTATDSSPMAGEATELPLVSPRQWIKFQDQVQSVTHESIGSGR